MPYDLYGQYYASSRDAINAETAQCAEIDARIAMNKVEELERQINYARQPTPIDEEIYYLKQHIENLEQRLAKLETIYG